MRSVPPRGSGVGLMIADCQLPICDWRLPVKANWQSAIANRKSEDHRYRVVGLTTFHCERGDAYVSVLLLEPKVNIILMSALLREWYKPDRPATLSNWTRRG
jgi:hypothetical protein